MLLCIRAKKNIVEFRALIKILLVHDFEKRKEGQLKSFHGLMKRQSVTSCSIWTGRVIGLRGGEGRGGAQVWDTMDCGARHGSEISWISAQWG